MKRFITVVAAFFVFFSQHARANDVVVPPLVASNVTPKDSVRYTRLIASEVEYLDIFDSVEELEYKTNKISLKCLNSNSCLNKLAKSKQVTSVVAGKVTRKSKTLYFELRYLKQGKTIRKHKFSMENKTAVIADQMGGQIMMLITGKAPKSENEESPSSDLDDELPDIDDEDLEDDPLGGLDLNTNSRDTRAAERAQRKRAAAEKKRLEEEARLRRKAEAKRRAEEAERKRLAEEKSRLAGLDDDLDDDADIDGDDGEYELDLRKHKARINQKKEEVVAPTPKRDEADDFDDDFSPKRMSTVKRNGTSGSAKATVTGRVGTAKFQDLNFVTYGGEIGYFINDSLSVIAGAEGHATQRKIPTEYLAEGEDPYQWNTILPINVGALYHRPVGPAMLQVGGDLILIPGYVRNAGSAAFGLRLRLGSNFMVSDGFGFNLNVAAGFWTGEDFQQVQSNLSSTGMAPQFSCGTVFAF